METIDSQLNGYGQSPSFDENGFYNASPVTKPGLRYDSEPPACFHESEQIFLFQPGSGSGLVVPQEGVDSLVVMLRLI